MGGLAEASRAVAERLSPDVTVQQRECELLRLIAAGLSNREIGEKLRVEKATIETYRTALEEKLGIKGRAALVRFAVAQGLVEGSLREYSIGPRFNTGTLPRS